MTAKGKAKELVSKFNNSYDEESKTYIIYQSLEESKRCALIAVEEILNPRSFLISIPLQDENYWQEVKQEIEKL
jgi:hypothetical protein